VEFSSELETIANEPVIPPLFVSLSLSLKREREREREREKERDRERKISRRSLLFAIDCP